MRFLGLDVGDATIGIAVSDELLLTAQGVETIRRKNMEKDLNRLGEIIKKYETMHMVIGLPKNMNGTEGERCDIVREFAMAVKKEFNDSNIYFWDERLSTVAAHRVLDEAGLGYEKKGEVVDKLAAVIILQNYLDSLAIAAKNN